MSASEYGKAQPSSLHRASSSTVECSLNGSTPPRKEETQTMKRIFTVFFATLLVLVALGSGIFWLRTYDKNDYDQPNGPRETFLQKIRRDFFHVDLADVIADPVAAAKEAGLANDWRMVEGPHTAIAGVQCSVDGWRNYMHRFERPEITYFEPTQDMQEYTPVREEPWTLSELTAARSYAIFNRQIILDPRNPMRPFCKAAVLEQPSQKTTAVSPTNEDPWKIVTLLPPQKDILSAVRADQRNQASLLPLPTRVEYDYFQISILGWAIIHKNYRILDRMTKEQKDPTFCRELLATYPNDGSEKQFPLRYALDHADKMGTGLLVQIMSSPACAHDEEGRMQQDYIFSKALHEADKQNPDMVLEVIKGYRSNSVNLNSGPNSDIFNNLIKNGNVTAARVAARKWGGSTDLFLAVEACDIERIKFWSNYVASSNVDLAQYQEAARSRGVYWAHPPDPNKKPNMYESAKCSLAVDYLRGVLHRRNPAPVYENKPALEWF